jgi:ArsR family transcriptional regulator, arsenate/arsenite/antimonite-responsive transcriptional repressor
MTDLFDVLADETRRDIVTLLSTAAKSNTEMSVGELVEALGVTQPTVSKHLKVLRDVGLVHVREDGQHRFYRINPAPLAEVSAWLLRVHAHSPTQGGAPFIDLNILGRAAGSLASDVIARANSAIGSLLR